MSENKVNNLLGASMDKIKEMVDVNTVVGDPITDAGRHDGHPGFPRELRLCRRRLGPAF
jgi:hypothetical protein